MTRRRTLVLLIVEETDDKDNPSRPSLPAAPVVEATGEDAIRPLAKVLPLKGDKKAVGS